MQTLSPAAIALIEAEARRRGIPVPSRDRGRVDLSQPPEWAHPGQVAAIEDDHRILLVVAGAQSGKTRIGPEIVLRRIQRSGPGVYAMVAPTYALMERQALPMFLATFEPYGSYNASKRTFSFSRQGLERLFGSGDEPCSVQFGYAENPNSLESVTLSGVWADECGQQEFRDATFENLLHRRLAVKRGWFLATTTPYRASGALRELHDRGVTGQDPDIGVVRFRSLDNPAYPLESWERAKRELPPWRFEMFHEGRFTRPAGQVYDCVGAANKCKRFRIPPFWPRLLGADFGATNTASVWAGMDPSDDRVYVYGSLLEPGLSVKAHAQRVLQKNPGAAFRAWGGNPAESGWREAFSAHGLPMSPPPFREVDYGIQQVYAAFATARLVVFEDLSHLWGEIDTYAYKIDPSTGERTEEIEDKHKFHRMDALRALICGLGHDAKSPRRARVHAMATQFQDRPDPDGDWLADLESREIALLEAAAR